MNAKNPPPRRILIVRLSALGDVVMSSGLIPALRSVHPDAHLAWLCEAASAPLLRHNPRLDEVIVWPRARWQELWKRKAWKELWREVASFRRSLRERRFDLVLDAHGLLKSGVLAWMTGAPWRIGLLPREGSQHLVHERLEPPPGADRRMGNEYRFLARHMGAADTAFTPDLTVGDQVRHQALAVLESQGISGPFVVLSPFTTRPQKHWFEDRWTALAAGLQARGLTPVLLGGPTDAQAAARIAPPGSGIVNLAGRLKLDESVAMVAEASMLIGVDTGLTHMGSALRRPTLALFGSTQPYADAASPFTRILYDALACSPCRRRPICDGRYDCMRQFTVERVLTEALALPGLPDAGGTGTPPAEHAPC